MFLLFNPLAWLGEKIVDTVASFFYTVFLWLNCIIYSFISYIYQIFLVLANGGDIFDKSAINSLVNRIYVILGVIVLFLVAYSLLKNMVNPDEALKGKESPTKTIMNVVTSIVLIAIVPTIFDFAFAFQNSLLNYNVIGKIIIGAKTNDADSETTIRNGGYNMAAGVWQAFIHINEDAKDANDRPYCRTIEEERDGKLENTDTECARLANKNGETYGAMWQHAKNTTTFFSLVGLVPFILDGSVTYLFIVDIVAGVYVLAVLLGYCFDMALRLVKLALYELIAPIPILTRIIPNAQTSKVFSNWIKATLTTFTEVFIRIAILYFGVLIIEVIAGSIDNLFTGGAYTASNTLPFVQSLAQAIIIIGIVMFIKQAPDIIKEITGLDSGKYNPFQSAMRAGAMLGGAATAAVRNWNAFTPDSEKPAWKNKFKQIGSAAAGMTSATARSTWNRDNIKDINSMKSNAHNAAEGAIKKRIRRENDKREMEAYYQNEGQGKQTKGIAKLLGGDTVKYRAHQAGERAKAWAGIDAVDSVTVSRTKELADRIDSNFSALEGTWKKSQAFIDAKAETDKLEKQQLAMQARIDELRRNGENENKIWTIIKSEWGMTKDEIDVKAKNAKAIQKQIEKGEQIKKAESIANAARNIQLATSQYSDVEIDMGKVLERYKPEISDPNLSTQEKERIQTEFKKVMETYKDLSNAQTYQQLVDDLKSSDDKVRANATAYIDILDKMNLQAKSQKDAAAFAEAQKQSTFKKDSGGSK